jgi:predicted GNAT superfamily acetyltransferase
MSPLEVRAVSAVDELRACEDMQAEVWGYSDREIVPKNELLAAVRSGGSLLGAFEAGTLVGFAYGMAGLDEVGPYLSSRLLAVRQTHRSKGLGETLKLAQKGDASRLGYPRIRWTQDALQAANARLNFKKLGATARSYVVDYYGSTSSPLHGTLPTDRLEVVWELDRERRPVTTGGASLLEVAGSGPGEPREVPPGARQITIAVPGSFTEILAKDPALANAWRLATRVAFQRAFAAGFEVVGFEPPGVYILGGAGVSPGGAGVSPAR